MRTCCCQVDRGSKPLSGFQNTTFCAPGPIGFASPMGFANLVNASLDDDSRRRPARRARGDRGPDIAGDRDKMSRMRAVGLGRDNGAAVVGGLANPGLERYLAKIWNAPAFGLQPRAAMAEDRR